MIEGQRGPGWWWWGGGGGGGKGYVDIGLKERAAEGRSVVCLPPMANTTESIVFACIAPRGESAQREESRNRQECG